MTLTAIVLAGGRSSRFGKDKLAAALGDTSVLAATIEAVAPLADRVIVAGPSLPQALAGWIGFDTAWPLLGLGAILAQIVVLPFVAATAVLQYFDLRVRTEGLDLEMTAIDLLDRAA